MLKISLRALALLSTLLLPACGPNTRTIPVPKLVLGAPPEGLTQETPAPAIPSADAWSREAAKYIPACRAALASCNADKSEIRMLYSKPLKTEASQ